MHWWTRMSLLKKVRQKTRPRPTLLVLTSRPTSPELTLDSATVHGTTTRVFRGHHVLLRHLRLPFLPLVRQLAAIAATRTTPSLPPCRDKGVRGKKPGV